MAWGTLGNADTVITSDFFTCQRGEPNIDGLENILNKALVRFYWSLTEGQGFLDQDTKVIYIHLRKFEEHKKHIKRQIKNDLYPYYSEIPSFHLLILYILLFFLFKKKKKELDFSFFFLPNSQRVLFFIIVG